MSRRFITFFFLSITHVLLCQEKKISHKNENWTQAYGNLRLSNNWGLAVDLGYRFKNGFERTTLVLTRIGAVFYFTNRISLSAGIAYFRNYPKVGFSIPEIRPFQRLAINSKTGIFSISQRYRIEERFTKNNVQDTLINTYKFNYRFGYQLNIQFPLNGKTIDAKKIFINFYDEILINFGKQILVNQFDQNRIFLGIGYQISKPSNVVLGYQYIWQQTNGVNKFNSIDCIRLTFTYNIDTRKEN